MRASYWLVGVGLVLSACGGTTDPSGQHTQPAPGVACQSLGATAPADDGCNTCTCTEEGWACTEKACVAEGECAPGDTKVADDGCNRCGCKDDGTWTCNTLVECGPEPTDECPEPAALPDDTACDTVVIFGRSEETGACCSFPTPCQVPEGFTPFYSQEECEAGESDPVCEPGATKDAEDGCNTCFCTDDGRWGCTLIGCGQEGVGCGGWLGDTCSKDEYCAYEEGQLCGGTDASATCEPRPPGCMKDYAPVCGCDGQSYDNACLAAAAGTGVYTSGACATTDQ